MRILTLIILFTLSLEIFAYDNKLELGIKTTSYSYTERDSHDDILDTEESDLFEVGGIYGSYEYKIHSYSLENKDILYYLHLYASITEGDTDYTGSLLGSNQGYGSYHSTTDNTFYEVQCNIKRVSQYQSNTQFISLGLGYKEWERKLSSAQEETYYYLFVQAVYGIEKNIYRDWSLGLELTGQLAHDPEMEADFSGGTDGLHETFDLGTTYSYKITLPLTIPVQERLNFITRAEYEFVSISKSNEIAVPNYPNPGDSNVFYEPKSQQKNWHLYAGVQLAF